MTSNIIFQVNSPFYYTMTYENTTNQISVYTNSDGFGGANVNNNCLFNGWNFNPSDNVVSGYINNNSSVTNIYNNSKLTFNSYNNGVFSYTLVVPSLELSVNIEYDSNTNTFNILSVPSNDYNAVCNQFGWSIIYDDNVDGMRSINSAVGYAFIFSG